MRRKIPKLQKIDNDRAISMETDSVFLLALQNSLLLALREQGRLNEMQYRIAAEQLKARSADRRVKIIQKRGEIG